MNPLRNILNMLMVFAVGADEASEGAICVARFISGPAHTRTQAHMHFTRNE